MLSRTSHGATRSPRWWSRSSGGPRPDWGVLRRLGKATLAHNWLNLAITVPQPLIPVLVTVVVSPSANAAFYAAWMLVGVMSTIASVANFRYVFMRHSDSNLVSRSELKPMSPPGHPRCDLCQKAPHCGSS